MLNFLRRTDPTPATAAVPAASAASGTSTAPALRVLPGGGGAGPRAAGGDAAAIHDVFVARQPIFDAQSRLFAYELLYRGGASHTSAGGVTADVMCTDTVIHTLISIGMGPLTGGTLAFVNVTRDFLLGGQYELFDRKTVVIELLETVEPDDEVVAACERLVARGYTLALDDFVNSPRYERLLRLAKIVKIDVLDKSEPEIRRAAEELRKYGVRLLAERVETAEVHEQCRALGYTLFQGYFYSRPQIVSHRELGVEQAQMLRLMNLLENTRAGDAEIENTFRSDPSLSYKLLRIANSAAMGGRDVESIGYALRMVGRSVLHRWLTLLLVSSVATRSGIGRELVLAALVRARLCELVAERSGAAREAGPRFLVGLFSLLDALLQMPMEGILDRMSIASDVKDALLRRAGPHAATLALAEAQERGDWQAVHDASAAVGLPAAHVSVLYTEALGWAAERVSGGF
jgi:EAL and modified HD-GYP domain-containing signal transduction protein